MTAQSHYHNCGAAVQIAPHLSTFSAINLLKSYNQILIPADISQRYRQLMSQNSVAEEYKLQTNSLLDLSHSALSLGNHTPDFLINNQPNFLSPHPILGYQHIAPLFSKDPALSPASERKIINDTSRRRLRGEKKPIPEEQKDDKYFERRRRNNQAAKKSRDARKMREDQIAFRATMLEHENALLRAQILTLREETSSLRQMLIAKKTDQSQSLEHQINCR